ncbi:unnamed protein product [Ceutorhynchus assimilis]|uniref:Uncharacterized protein n=1 Tax=Ceutorhynchus assimilis TaxID=467358 RepID=A0A9N9QPW5_9CUCU|nr:unnamed protein product [Ceutorhynchus assimilis]
MKLVVVFVLVVLGAWLASNAEAKPITVTNLDCLENQISPAKVIISSEVARLDSKHDKNVNCTCVIWPFYDDYYVCEEDLLIDENKRRIICNIASRRYWEWLTIMLAFIIVYASIMVILLVKQICYYKKKPKVYNLVRLQLRPKVAADVNVDEYM